MTKTYNKDDHNSRGAPLRFILYGAPRIFYVIFEVLPVFYKNELPRIYWKTKLTNHRSIQIAS